MTIEHRGAFKEQIREAFEKFNNKPKAVSANAYCHDRLMTDDIIAIASESAKKFVNDKFDDSKGNTIDKFEGNKFISIRNLITCSSNLPLLSVKLNEFLCVPCLLDTGTDYPVIGVDLVKILRVNTCPLEQPIHCEFPTSNVNAIVCTQRTRLDIDITFPGTAKHLICPEVAFVVLDAPMQVKVLLGNSFLRAQGIDVKHLLATKATHQSSHQLSEKEQDHLFTTSIDDVNISHNDMLEQARTATMPVHATQCIDKIIDACSLPSNMAPLPLSPRFSELTTPRNPTTETSKFTHQVLHSKQPQVSELLTSFRDQTTSSTNKTIRVNDTNSYQYSHISPDSTYTPRPHKYQKRTTIPVLGPSNTHAHYFTTNIMHTQQPKSIPQTDPASIRPHAHDHVQYINANTTKDCNSKSSLTPIHPK